MYYKNLQLSSKTCAATFIYNLLNLHFNLLIVCELDGICV